MEQVNEIRVQELCESRGGRPGLSVRTSLLVSVDVSKANIDPCSRIGLSLSLISQPTSEDIRHRNRTESVKPAGGNMCTFSTF